MAPAVTELFAGQAAVGAAGRATAHTNGEKIARAAGFIMKSTETEQMLKIGMLVVYFRADITHRFIFIPDMVETLIEITIGID